MLRQNRGGVVAGFQEEGIQEIAYFYFFARTQIAIGAVSGEGGATDLGFLAGLGDSTGDQSGHQFGDRSDGELFVRVPAQNNFAGIQVAHQVS